MPARVPLVLVPGLAGDEELFAAESAGLADVADVVVPDILRPVAAAGRAPPSR